MRRTATVLLLTLASVASFATQALAQYPPTKTTEPPAPPEGGIAFTGASISIGVIVLVALVVVGALLFLAGRRQKVQ